MKVFTRRRGALFLAATALLLVGAALARQPAHRVAVMVYDEGGRGPRLAERVVADLRAHGVEAVAVLPPAKPAARAEDAAAEQAGANRVLALEVKTVHNGQIASGPQEKPYDPELRVWRFAIQPVIGPIEPHNEVGPPGPNGALSEQSSIDMQGWKPKAKGLAPLWIRQEVRTETRAAVRRVGEPVADSEHTVGMGAATVWREDLVPPGQGRERPQIELMWNRLFDEVAKGVVQEFPR